jgi:hypothetical protein
MIPARLFPACWFSVCFCLHNVSLHTGSFASFTSLRVPECLLLLRVPECLLLLRVTECFLLLRVPECLLLLRVPECLLLLRVPECLLLLRVPECLLLLRVNECLLLLRVNECLLHACCLRCSFYLAHRRLVRCTLGTLNFILFYLLAPCTLAFLLFLSR